MIGKTISHYRILEKIGEGGMGVVYKAHDTKLDRLVALKFLPPELTRDEEAKKRFVHEAQAASSLQHSNICTIHDIDETKDARLYIVMDCYEGETLKKKIGRGLLEPEDIIDYSIQIAEGLGEAHEKDIIHRDIKSANIMVTSKGQVKIMDFGLAKLTGLSSVTKTGMKLGTIHYMSPEQTKGEGVDRRTDIWSLGVVLYEMISGELPFKGDYEQAVIYSILNENPAPLADLRKSISPDFEKVVNKCLAKNPDQRYQTNRELLIDLKRLKRKVPIRQNSPERASLGTAFRKAIRKAPILLAAIVFVLAAWILVLKRVPIPGFRNLRPLPAEKHLAVLPFTNVGNLPENQAFCDGLLEIITSKLTQLEEFQGSLWVVPSSEIRKAKITSVLEAKRKFGVNLSTTGSFQKENGHFLLTLNLVDARKVRQLDSFVIDDRITNVVNIQDGVLGRLADMLGIELYPHQLGVLEAGATRNQKANDCYIYGRGYLQNYQKEGNIQSAIKSFERAIHEDPNYALANAGLGEAYLRKYQLTKDGTWIQQAMIYCDRALMQESQLIPVHLTLGLIEIEMGRHEQAVQEFLMIIEKDSINMDAYLGLAQAKESMGNLEDAEKIYRKTIRMRPTYWGGYHKLGVFYNKQGRYQDAADQFRQVIALTPESVLAYSNLGAILFSMELMQEAQKVFERGIRIEPTYRLYSNLGTLFYYQLKFKDAAENYEKALVLNDTDYRIWGNLAESYYWISGKREKARAKFEKAAELAEQRLDINPQDAVAISDRSGYCARMGNRQKALSLLNQAIALNSSDLEVLFRIADVYEQLGERENALNWIEILLMKGYSTTKFYQYPTFRDLQSDERFKTLIKNSGRKEP